jgi:light-harvesting complex 1 beta chain
MTRAGPTPIPGPQRDDSAGGFAIFSVSFALFLAVAIGGASLGLQWRSWLPGAEGGQSLLGSVRSAVYTFMSYLP